MRERATVAYIARMSGLSVATVQRWADRGFIECKRDFRGWRWFPDADATVKRIKALLNGDIQLEEKGGQINDGE